MCKKHVLDFFQQHIHLIADCSFWGLGSVTQVLPAFFVLSDAI